MSLSVVRLIRARRTLGLGTMLLLILTTASCGATKAGFQYWPERVYYTSFTRLQNARMKQVRHVSRSKRAVYLLWLPLSSVDVRSMIAEELGQNPHHYVANLEVHTDTMSIPAILPLMTVPRTRVEFDIVEVRSAEEASSR